MQGKTERALPAHCGSNRPPRPFPPSLSYLQGLKDTAQRLEGRTLLGSKSASAKSWTTLRGQSRSYSLTRGVTGTSCSFLRERIPRAYSPKPHLELGGLQSPLRPTFAPSAPPPLRAHPFTSPHFFSPLFINENNSSHLWAFEGLNTTTETT